MTMKLKHKYSRNKKNKKGKCNCDNVIWSVKHSCYLCDCGHIWYSHEISVCDYCERDYIHNRGVKNYDEDHNKFMEFCSDSCFNNYYFSLERKPFKLNDNSLDISNSTYNINNRYDKYDDYINSKNSSTTSITKYTGNKTNNTKDNKIYIDYLEQKKNKLKALKALHECNYINKPNGVDLILCTEWCSICGNCDVECDCNTKIDSEIELYTKQNTAVRCIDEWDEEDYKPVGFSENGYICKFCSEINYHSICTTCGAINSDYTYQEPDYRSSLSDEEQDRSNIEELNGYYEDTDIISTKDKYNSCKCVEVTNTASSNFRCKCGWLYGPDQIATCALCDALFIIGRGYSFHIGTEEYEVCSQQCMYYNGEEYAYMSGLCNS